MYASRKFLAQLPAGSTLVSTCGGEIETTWLGFTPGGDAIVKEDGKVQTFNADFFTGHSFTFFDVYGYLIPKSEMLAVK